jgi:hypothetical protein
MENLAPHNKGLQSAILIKRNFLQVFLYVDVHTRKMMSQPPLGFSTFVKLCKTSYMQHKGYVSSPSDFKQIDLLTNNIENEPCFVLKQQVVK